MNIRHLSIIVLSMLCISEAIAQKKTEWNPKWQESDAKMLTLWGEKLDPSNVLPEYPRPQLVRAQWRNLNGEWEFQEALESDLVPYGKKLKNKILVPFCWESPLSGIREFYQRGWYRRTFTIPEDWNGQQIQLNFGAVDWEATVYVNGVCVGKHQGGYDAFSYDITSQLKKSGSNEIIVHVYDPSNREAITTGKQYYQYNNDPQWCLYSTSSGIWQTVWLEPVPKKSIQAIKIIPDLKTGTFQARVSPNHKGEYRTEITILDNGKEVAKKEGGVLVELPIKIENPHLWSPEDPHLYDVIVRLKDKEGKLLDEVKSYTAMRSVGLKKMGDVPCLSINDEIQYQSGPLDQGYWPDGFYTAPSDEAIRWEINEIKDWGFNMIRKHAKLESDRWYYWCDKLGIVVWQDMPYCGDVRNDEQKILFEQELQHMITQRWNHPSIIMWTVFNEHWGLYDLERITENVMSLDPSRLVMGNSGIDAKWPKVDYEVGHIKDNHSYLPPTLPLISDRRATVNGEYGALGYDIKGHRFSDNGKYMHAYYKDKEDKKEAATAEYEEFMKKNYEYIRSGLSGSVYTQWTDLENEVNGLYTYDRKVIKLDKERVRTANKRAYEMIKERPWAK